MNTVPFLVGGIIGVVCTVFVIGVGCVISDALEARERKREERARVVANVRARFANRN